MENEQTQPYHKIYYESHKEQIKVNRAAYYLRNKKTIKSRNDAYRIANREAIRAGIRARHKSVKAIINTIKTTKGCVDCGYNANPVALDFDHVVGEKSFNIARSVRSMKLERLLSEIAKCEVRCANCHRIKTSNNEDWK